MPFKPVFLIDEDRRSAALLEVYCKHPEIAQVLANINLDRELAMGVVSPGCSRKMLEIYIRTLFVPVLVEHDLVRPQPEKQCGFEALYSDIQVDPRLLSFPERAAVAKRAMEAIVESVTDEDSTDTTIVAPLSFSVSPQKAAELMAAHKTLLQEQLRTPDYHGPDTVLYRVAVAGKIYR